MTNRKHMCAFIPHLKEVGIPACGRNFGGCGLLSVTDEDFQKMWGCSIEESTHRTMLFAGWCEAVAKWNQEHGNDRQYHVLGFEPRFSGRQVCDMAQLFYRWGQEDGRNGVSEYDRLWKLNKKEVV